MGYTPVFSSIYDGTLYGKWPDAAVFATLLPLADAQGRIDMSLQAIAGRTGWPLELLRQGIEGLCSPDTESRTDAEDGRRMVLLDPSRPWGWRLVNHGKYREKARKAAFDAERIASGQNAARMAARRPDETRADPRRPDETRADPPSDSDTDSNTDKNGREARKRAPTAQRIPEDFELTPERRKVAEAENADPDREFAKFTDHWRAASGANARKHDWDATWRNWCRKAAEFRRGPAQASQPAQTWRPTDDEDDHAHA
jgi:hypothetical protein